MEFNYHRHDPAPRDLDPYGLVRFLVDPQREDVIWVDRGLEDKVDQFARCECLDGDLVVPSAGNDGWLWGLMCPDCQNKLEIAQAIHDATADSLFSPDTCDELADRLFEPLWDQLQ